MAMRGLRLVSGSLLIACVAASAFAQTSVDRSFTAASKDCSDVQWTDAALKTYPDIASACQGVEERNGKTYVKFQGSLARNIDRGRQLAISFKDGGTITLSPPANTQLYVNGRKTPVSDLERGDELNFYVPEDRLAAQFAEDETPQTRYVIVPIVYREVVAMEQEPQRQAAVLPSTGSGLPLAGLSGTLLLGFAASLTLYRLRRCR
jgi:hypothetical protein